MGVKLAGSPGALPDEVLCARELDAAMYAYEGLVHRTAQLLKSGEHPEMRGRLPIEDDLEDVEQVLRMKVAKALQAWDPAKSKGKSKNGRSPRDLYVHMCLRDRAKDVAKRRRRLDVYIEDVAPVHGYDVDVKGGSAPRDRFDERYLSQTAEEAYSEIEEDRPDLPDTFTARECDVALRMYEGRKQTEIPALLDISKREVETAVRAIRTKLAAARAE